MTEHIPCTHTRALSSFSRLPRASSCRNLEDRYQITVFREVERGEVVQVNIVIVVQSLSHDWLYDPMNCSMPDLSVLHYLPEFSQTHVHWVGNAILPSHPLPPSSTPQRLPSVFLSIWVFSSESALCIRWPNYWNFSFSICLSSEYSGLISFRIHWFDLLAVQGILKSLLQHHYLTASILRRSASSHLF